jgi:uncharacterized protein YaaR (DUF327 family)
MNELTKVEQLLQDIIAERKKQEVELLNHIEEINRLVL